MINAYHRKCHNYAFSLIVIIIINHLQPAGIKDLNRTGECVGKVRGTAACS